MEFFTPTRVSLIIIALVFTWLIPWVIKRNNLKDDIKFKNTLPIGTARFRAFLRIAGFVVLAMAVLSAIALLVD